MDRKVARRVWYRPFHSLILADTHSELLVMAMVVSRDSSLALTVSADHLLGRYDLVVSCS